MISVKLPNLDIDADVKIDEKGLSISMKKFDINNFSIDKVFKHFEKKFSKSKSKKSDKIESSMTSIQNEDEYLIEIQ